MSEGVAPVEVFNAANNVAISIRNLKTSASLLKAKTAELEAILTAASNRIVDISNQTPTKDVINTLNLLNVGIQKTTQSVKLLKNNFENINDAMEALIE